MCGLKFTKQSRIIIMLIAGFPWGVDNIYIIPVHIKEPSTRLRMEQKSRHNMRQVNSVFTPIVIILWYFVCSQRGSHAGSRSNSRVGSRADSSMAGSIHQARFGSRSFISSKSNLTSSSRKNLASDSMRFQKPLAQVRNTVYKNEVLCSTWHCMYSARVHVHEWISYCIP